MSRGCIVQTKVTREDWRPWAWSDTGSSQEIVTIEFVVDGAPGRVPLEVSEGIDAAVLAARLESVAEQLRFQRKLAREIEKP